MREDDGNAETIEEKDVPGVYWLFIRQRKRPVLKLVEAVVGSDFDECANEKWGSLAGYGAEYKGGLVLKHLLTFSLSTMGFPAGVVSSISSM